MKAIDLHSTRCAICGTEENSAELYAANFALENFNPLVFSARRLPDRIHYRMMKCAACGLVRADPRAETSALTELYKQSTFDYSGEVENLKRTYGRYLAKLDLLGANKNSLLEIGCGNGFFLEQAVLQGYADVRGVEPSTEAVSHADSSIRSHIVCDVMREELFPNNTFDVICLFQVFDHIPDPGALLDVCHNVLKPGGFILFLNHNIEAVSARLLGERSPIIDIEHTYLYSSLTQAKLLEDHGFRVCKTGAVFNTYTLHYLMRLIPFSSSLKRKLLEFVQATWLGKIRLPIPLGNLYLAATKPHS